MDKRRTFLLALGIVSISMLGALLSNINAIESQKPCPSDLTEITSQAEQERCVEAKERNLALRYESLSRTAGATPQNPPISPTANPAYGTAIPEGVIPLSHGEEVEQVAYAKFEGYWFFRDKESIWYLGNAPHVESSYSRLYAWTAQRTNEHAAQIGLHMPSGGLAAYNQTWELPSDISSITITGSRNLNTSGEQPLGVLTFITNHRIVGELDFAEGIRLLP